jgi:predicted small lipoprotein YifL
VYYLRNAIFLAIIVSTFSLAGCGIRNDPVYTPPATVTK